jgi:hypothetical protein
MLYLVHLWHANQCKSAGEDVDMPESTSCRNLSTFKKNPRYSNISDYDSQVSQDIRLRSQNVCNVQISWNFWRWHVEFEVLPWAGVAGTITLCILAWQNVAIRVWTVQKFGSLTKLLVELELVGMGGTWWNFLELVGTCWNSTREVFWWSGQWRSLRVPQSTVAYTAYTADGDGESYPSYPYTWGAVISYPCRSSKLTASSQQALATSWKTSLTILTGPNRSQPVLSLLKRCWSVEVVAPAMIIGGLLGRVFGHVLLPAAEGKPRGQLSGTTAIPRHRGWPGMTQWREQRVPRPEWFVSMILTKDGKDLRCWPCWTRHLKSWSGRKINLKIWLFSIRLAAIGSCRFSATTSISATAS